MVILVIAISASASLIIGPCDRRLATFEYHLSDVSVPLTIDFAGDKDTLISPVGFVHLPRGVISYTYTINKAIVHGTIDTTPEGEWYMGINQNGIEVYR